MEGGAAKSLGGGVEVGAAHIRGVTGERREHGPQRVTQSGPADMIERHQRAAEKVIARGRKPRTQSDQRRQAAGIERWRAEHPVPRATLQQVADHIDHIRKVAGIDHIGLGGDFDGITDVVQGLEDVSKYPDLTAELLKRGYSDADVKKIIGQNVLRVPPLGAFGRLLAVWSCACPTRSFRPCCLAAQFERGLS